MSENQQEDESTEQELGYITGPAAEIEDIVRKTSLTSSSDPFHDEVYISIQDGVLNTIARTGSSMSYCTYTEASNLQEIVSNVEGGVEAVIPVTKYLSYKSLITKDGTVKLAFRGKPDDRLSNVLEFTGSLNARIMLPASAQIINDVPTGLPERFNDDNELLSKNGDPLPTVIETNTENVRKIIDVVEYDSEVKFYPITVKDGDFTLSVGVNEDRNAVWGEIEARNVETEADVDNDYHRGFEPAFNTLHGNVVLQTTPAEQSQAGPLAIIQDELNGTVLRHVIGNVNG